MQEVFYGINKNRNKGNYNRFLPCNWIVVSRYLIEMLGSSGGK